MSRRTHSLLVSLITVAVLAGLLVAWPGVLPLPVRQLVGLGPERLSPPVQQVPR